jgi:Replication protein
MDPPDGGCENAPDPELGGSGSEASEIEALPGRVARYERARASALEMLAHLDELTKLQNCKAVKPPSVGGSGRRRGRRSESGICADTWALIDAHLAQGVQRVGSLGAASLDPGLARQKLQDCGNWLVFAHYFTVDKVRLSRASFCKEHLLCPLCAIRRGAKLLAAYLRRFQAIAAARPELVPYLVTLTVKNGPDLGERFRHLHAAYRQLQKRRMEVRTRSVLRQVAGGVTSYEFTNRGKGWHPHVHSLVLSASEPLQADLAREWHSITSDSYIVDVRPFYAGTDPLDGFLEVFKYAVKFGELDPSLRWEAYRTLRGRRLLSSFGAFRGVMIPDELTDEPLDDLPFLELLYRYTAARGYEFQGAPTRRAEAAQAAVTS